MSGSEHRSCESTDADSLFIPGIDDNFHPSMASPQNAAPDTIDGLLDTIYAWNSEAPCVWRGQARLEWTAVPSLYRRLSRAGLSKGQITETKILNAEQEIMRKAKNAGVLQDYGDDILRFMVDLQHWEGSTRLLDVTHDPLVALYFACEQPREYGYAGVLLRYQIRPSRIVRQDESASWQDIVDARSKGRPTLLEPRPSNKRIRAQKGAFITTSLPNSTAEPNLFTHQTLDSQIDLIWIRMELKAKAMESLASMGYTRSKLMPESIEHFAPRFGSSWIPKLDTH